MIEGKNWIFTLFDVLGMFLFSFPHLAQSIVSNDKYVQNIGITIVLISYTFANFVLYKKNKIKSGISEKSVELYSHHKIYSCAQVHYFGKEPVQDLEVHISYTDKTGKEINQTVSEYTEYDAPNFPGDNLKILVENDKKLFRLPEIHETSNGKVFIDINFIGAQSRIKVHKRQELILKDSPPLFW